jgi:iron complex transport system substrate-binding protein
MKLKRTIAPLVALAVMAAALAGCQTGNQDAADGASFTVTDMAGREITLEGPAERIVVLAASDCEILYAIGAGGSVVGRGEYCDYPSEVADKPVVSSGGNTNVEEILALEPQVVVMSVMAQTEEQVAALEEAGVRCVVSDAQDIAGVYEAIELMGAITGRAGEAASVIGGMKEAFAEIEGKAEKDSGKTVYFEISSLQWGDPWMAGGGTFMDELAAMAGLTNIFADVKGWAQISQEQVIERNPDYIVTVEMYTGDGPSPEEEIMGREGWQDISAIKNGAVFNADNNEISRPGPRLADAARALYEFVYVTAAQPAAA